jgi:hypothetical protein
MKERPVVFSGPLVRALLAGQKTQERRVVKLREFQPSATPGYDWTFRDRRGCWNDYTTTDLVTQVCPYGGPGDRLWVRETFCVGYEHESGRFTVLPFQDCEVHRRAFYRATDPDPPDEPQRPWRRSSHMPRWASRIMLEITRIRVERLQAITEGDCWAEGLFRVGSDLVTPCPALICEAPGVVEGMAFVEHVGPPYYTYAGNPRKAFSVLWNSTHNRQGYCADDAPCGWGANPWVWCVDFFVAKGPGSS